jgi:hypothetical protein
MMEADRTRFHETSNLTPGRQTRKIAILKGLLILLLLFALPAIWRWTPLNHWINLATVIGWQESVRNHPGAFYLVVGAYLLGSLVLFPVTMLNVATVFTFGRSSVTFTPLPAGSPARRARYRTRDGRQMVRTGSVWRPLLDRRHGFLTVSLRVFRYRLLVNVFIGAWGIRFGIFIAVSSMDLFGFGQLAGVQAKGFLATRRAGLLG